MTQVQRKRALAALAGLTFALVFGLPLFMAFVTSPAYAQTVVDLKPAVLSLIDIVAAALGVASTILVGFATRFMATKAGLEKSRFEENLNMRLDDAIHKGIDYARTRVIQEVNDPNSSITSVRVDNFFLGLAVNYVAKRMPETLARFKIDPESLKEKIEARLPNYLEQLTGINQPVAADVPAPKEPKSEIVDTSDATRTAVERAQAMAAEQRRIDQSKEAS